MNAYSQKTKVFGSTKIVLGTLATVVLGLMLLAVVLVVLDRNHFFVADKPVSFSSVKTQAGATATASVLKINLEAGGARNCPTPSVCYAVDSNGIVAISSDQGNAWQATPTSLNLEGELGGWQMSCPDDKTCFLAVHNRRPPYSNYYISTKDGARSWNVQAGTPTGNVYEVKDLECPNASFCVAATSDGFQITRDGGQTWTNKSISNARFFNDIACVDANTCFAVGGIAGPENIQGYLFVTTDGAKNWTKKSKDNLPLSTITCLAKDNCIVGAQEGLLFRVTDGGNKWEKLTYPKDNNQYFTVTSISCLGVTRCLFTASKGDTLQGGGTYFSKDAGNTWQLNNTTDLRWAKCTLPGLCYGTSFSGNVLTSNDGGETWHK